MATADLPRRPAPTPPPAQDPSPRLWTPDEFARMQRMRLFGDRDVLLDAGTVMERHPDGARPAEFTQTEFSALWNANYFLNQRVQLIRGVIVQEPPMNPPHATAVYRMMMAALRTFPTGHVVRPQLPLDLGRPNLLFPDVAVVAGSADDYATRHPTTAVLLVEVADTTLFDDLTTKAELYAEAGIKDYWVVDIPKWQVHVLRDPAPVGGNGHSYRDQRVLGPDESVTPLAAPEARIAAAELLPVISGRVA